MSENIALKKDFRTDRVSLECITSTPFFSTISQIRLKNILETPGCEIKKGNLILFKENGRILTKKDLEKLIYQFQDHGIKEPFEEHIILPQQVTVEEIKEDFLNLTQTFFDGTKYNFSHVNNEIQRLVKEVNFNNTIRNAMTLLKNNDNLNFKYSLLCAIMATTLGQQLGYDISKQVEIFSCGLFHDIGKLYLDPKIITKETFELTEEDFKNIRLHPIFSHLLLKNGTSKNVSECGLYHHECIDGSGYPLGLKGDSITEYPRIINVIGSFVAMYQRGKKSINQILKILDRYSMNQSAIGEQIEPLYDSNIVDMLSKLNLPMESIKTKFEDYEYNKIIKCCEFCVNIYEGISNLEKTINKCQTLNEEQEGFLAEGKRDIKKLKRTLDTSSVYQTENLPKDDELLGLLLTDIEVTSMELKRYKNLLGSKVSETCYRIYQHSTSSGKFFTENFVVPCQRISDNIERLSNLLNFI